MSDQPAADERVAGLRALLRRQIAGQGGRITFRDYMDAVLYAPGYGYYAAGAVSLGRGGDFVTSPEVDPTFGLLLARWLARIDAALDHPTPLTVIEMGAGTGRLAADLLAGLHSEHPTLFDRVRYRIIERSAGLRAQQQELLAGLPGATVDWLDGLASLPPGSVQGAFLSNELVDAFPVHRVVMTEAGLQEIYVSLNAGGAFHEEIGPLSDPRLADHLAWLGVALPPGARGEINLDAVAWIGQVAGALGRGAVLTIDYGDTAERLYSDLRPEGTLLCYTQGRVSSDPFAAPGAQDITAHVDFTALTRAGLAAGLTTLTLTRQMYFLAQLGLGELLAGLGDRYSAHAATLGRIAASEALLAERARLFRLIDPDRLGRFHVLLQARDLDPAGLQFAF
jgi:SAM-dependent MidA family methyltransferase